MRNMRKKNILTGQNKKFWKDFHKMKMFNHPANNLDGKNERYDRVYKKIYNFRGLFVFCQFSPDNILAYRLFVLLLSPIL